ncbi:nuclear transport factor 2 family protein [Salinimicrobium sp. GXAS 041]|uniref:nuclear transport factor 2 family protein n=1 Tax=Salinimicrobium sp. GXAS 041 TaxID=3400806 RepID=UPI003C744AD8
MSLEPKQCVEKFYTTDFFQDVDTLSQYLHPEATLFWNSSGGFNKLNFEEIKKLSVELSRSFNSLRAEVSHLLKEDDTVTIRFTYYVETKENPDEELPMAHFICIWEFKEGKMHKGYQISQQADDSPENLSSFLRSNI